jgi:hypothetical protein
VLTGLDHPNVVRVRDLVAEAIVVDFVPGSDLRRVLARSGTLPPALDPADVLALHPRCGRALHR